MIRIKQTLKILKKNVKHNLKIKNTETGKTQMLKNIFKIKAFKICK